MSFLGLTFLLLNLHRIANGFDLPPPKGTIKIVEVEVCESSNTLMTMDARFDTIRGDDKALSFTASLPVEINVDTAFAMVMDKWADDEWFLNFYQKDGKFCDLMKNMLVKMWADFSEAVVPNLGIDCPHLPGNYSLENFELNRDASAFPDVILGLFRTTFKFFDESGDDLFCLILTFDSS